MEWYVIWIVAIVALCLVEALTSGLLTIWFAFGALCALFAAMAGASPLVQFAVFAVVSAILLGATRPVLLKKLKVRDEKTNADRILGQTGVVSEEITPDKFAGKVRVRGQEWSAVSEDGSSIAEGVTVEAVRIEGVRLVVRICQ
ncbi:MAG: NfeD family protein [Ruminococcaceae bacterium]|nr:NfeD family protein [Oscillospiraceae bacterium]